VIACGVAARRDAAPAPAPIAGTHASISNAERLRWVTLAFLPSALMLAVTTYITTDIAATPLFWVVPLAIYIGTYILAFAHRQLIGQRALLVLQGIALAAAALAGLTVAHNVAGLFIALSAFTFTAAVCHTELARLRPDVRRLTGYYLLVSLGGALGGAFSALLAPVLFVGPWEYPLLLIAACLLRPPARPVRQSEDWAIRGDFLLPVALTALATALLWAASATESGALRSAANVASFAVPGMALLWFARRRVRLAMALASFLLFPAFVDASGALMMARSFFGGHRVRSLPDEDLVVLQHGTTVHGMQSTRPGEELMPLLYYDRAGPSAELSLRLANGPCRSLQSACLAWRWRARLLRASGRDLDFPRDRSSGGASCSRRPMVPLHGRLRQPPHGGAWRRPPYPRGQRRRTVRPDHC